MQVAMVEIDVNVILSFCECFFFNSCSVSMIANYLSAIKANFVLYNMSYSLLDHPRIKYFQKSMRINRPLALTSHNVIDLCMLERISESCDHLNFPEVFRAIFLTGFFEFFFRLSNLAPHLTGYDLCFTKNLVKILIKWSKTMQTRDAVQVISLPKVSNRAICPFRALKALKKFYPMTATHSAFQINTSGGWQPLTDSRVRKALKSINMTLGLDPAFFTYHSFFVGLGQHSLIMPMFPFSR